MGPFCDFAPFTKGNAFLFAPPLLAWLRYRRDPMRNTESETTNVETLAQSFTDSAMFDRTFDEGMALVEETARYLDGKGREEARTLPRKTAMLYAGESMRVTTRLMQAASWLLVQRAVCDGDMDKADAMNERYRLGSKEICLGSSVEDTGALPRELRDLLGRSDSLYRRIARLDDILFGEGEAASPGARGQQNALAQAFGP
jgi:regulator of CtrA degradation